MPNELGDSLFSPKSLSGERRALSSGGRALVGLGAVRLPNPFKLRMPLLAARQLDGESQVSSSRGEQPRPTAKAPKGRLSGKRCGRAETARRLA